MSPDRVIERVNKLVRLAAPDSGATEAERVSAALEVTKLLHVHSLVLSAPVARKEPRPRRAPATSRPYTGPTWQSRTNSTPPVGGWVRGQALRDVASRDNIEASAHRYCIECGQEIFFGDTVWIRMKVFQPEYLHADGTCGW